VRITGAIDTARDEPHSGTKTNRLVRLEEGEISMSVDADSCAQYRAAGDPALNDYFPPWLNNMAEDATVEGSMLDGVVVGKEAVQTVVKTIRSLYDWQQFHSVGPYGDNGWIEDYAAEVRGEPIGCVVLVTRNAAGQTEHVMASYRPRTSVVHFASLLAEKFAGSPLAEYFCEKP
jgi:hypothetical protein